MRSKEILQGIGSRLRAQGTDIVEAKLPARLLDLVGQLRSAEDVERRCERPTTAQPLRTKAVRP